MKTVFSYLSSYKARMAFGLFLKAVGTFAELVLPLIMAYMIDDVAPTQNALALSLWGAAMLVCAVAALVGNVTANRMGGARYDHAPSERSFCKNSVFIGPSDR